ncbi:MAG: prepilin-type N-terminal cleavage/methylation domain-containing protein [Gammaproteobacteria bacterium]|nr:prepilin-type N-terminal cleavage/methylation domain-containing protein [Gammaproteobacteria bacterium]MBU2059446.1 prepilin-type N-terminal cleavage/methylation domain-containing protein [Gammaproteobacteria bacterium]MBU2175923.1 prepilin-type N-terminal cleavage/methylation domain-containing protein [Gammaproteobacteria bacterium]MBU2246337.1 prepilin-type N-terminal cleavage/methylation domain-containing protein [Gammaproteobacteria bacterium]MBU2346338.1 prepilin-type N-terminal cleavag
MKLRTQGIGLIELLVVLAIMGILASVLLPGYQDHVLKGHRAEAMQALLKVAGLQEMLLVDQHRYSADLTELGFAAKQFVTESGRYKVSAVVTEQGYLLKAQAQQAQSEDKSCQVFLLNSYGQKSSEPDSACWSY